MDDSQPVPTAPPDPVVEPRVDPEPTPVQTVLTPSPSERRRHRVTLIFYHLMRSHLGVAVVENIAEMCARGVVGPGQYDDLMRIAEQCAARVLEGAPNDPL
jgi:hypothetical protein